MADQVFDPVSPQGEKKSNTTLIIIIVAVIVLCCICACIIFFAFPTLLGPEIGDVFSEIITEIETAP